MKIVPRWFQDEAIDSIWTYFADGNEGNPIVAMPTGTGKSVVIGGFCERVLTHYSDQRIMKLTHRKELIQQNFARLLEMWPLAPAGIYSAGLHRRDVLYPITFGGIASVRTKAHLFGWIDMLLIDECHLISPEAKTSYQYFIKGLKQVNPDLKVVGFTATPYRLKQGSLVEPGGLFTDVCYDITGYESFNRLIDEGWLCPLIPKRPDQELDLSQVGTGSDGDFDQHDLQMAVDKDDITRRAIAEMLRGATDRKCWLVFTAGVQHSDHVAVALNENGISAVSIHSKMTGSRDDAVADWKKGKYQAAVNNDILTTGIDHPAIDFIGDLQGTKSTSKHVQKYGRGTRPFPGKVNCLVYDFAGNTRRLGPINDPVLPNPKGKKRGKHPAPVKMCEACSTWNHARARFCCSCGKEFEQCIKFDDKADTREIIATKSRDFEPHVEIMEVDSTNYQEHVSKRTGMPSLRVTYCCGPVWRFNEHVCFQHTQGLPLHKAHEWWRARSTEPIPQTVSEALAVIKCSPPITPTHLRVWLNTKSGYPEIMAQDFTGSAFKVAE